MKFPMFGTPIVAIDFDGTLAEYSGWKGHDVVGEPRKNAVWALECFKENGWEIEIYTNRCILPPIWEWVAKYAPGTIHRVNESRKLYLEKEGEPISHKPKVDMFIDDRSWYRFGEELDWVEIMNHLSQKGLLKINRSPEC